MEREIRKVGPASYFSRLCLKTVSEKGTVPFFSPGTEKSGRSPTVLIISVLWVLAQIAFSTGCAEHRRACVPEGLLTPDAIDLNSSTERDPNRERQALAASLASIKAAQPADSNPDVKKYSVPALSGGGSYGAFSAGILNGWTASGRRPQFDIVSGVSTGALIATYAFLGPQYDQVLCKFYTSTTTDDIYTKRCK